MIAIPVDSATPGIKSSKLFGNVPMFAIYAPVDDTFFFIRNQEAGDGIKTAKSLKKWNVDSVVYTHMGEGPFKVLCEDGIEIYCIGKEPLPLFEIVKKLEEDAFVKVDETNAKTYLDPGNHAGECTCKAE